MSNEIRKGEEFAMRKYWILSSVLALTMALVALPMIASGAPAAKNFMAIMSADQEVAATPVVSDGTGVAIFQLSADGQSLSYKLNASNLNAPVTMSHIHMAPGGANGGVVVWLFPSSPPPSPGVESNGRLAEGTITAADLRGSLAGKWDLFVTKLNDGGLYVNVHTTAYPGGEIRGQIRVNGPKGD
jgi:hypothetical protein